MELESSNRGLERLAVPYDQSTVHATRAEFGDVLPGPSLDGNLGDGVLVGGLEVSVVPTGSGSLVQSLELVHGTEVGGRGEEGGGGGKKGKKGGGGKIGG